MNIIVPLLFLPVMLSWTFPNFIFKRLTKYFDNMHIVILYHIVFHLVILPIIIYNIVNKTENYNNFLKNAVALPLKYKFALLGITILSIVAQYSYFTLLRRYDVTTVMPIIRGGSSILLITFGYFIFKENINLQKIIGIFVVIAGMYIITKA